jgi:hypothetical protein
VNAILEETVKRDKDYRYMATSDLLLELQKDSFKPDTDGERKICKALLKLLNDQSSDVQGLAVKWCAAATARCVSWVGEPSPAHHPLAIGRRWGGPPLLRETGADFAAQWPAVPPPVSLSAVPSPHLNPRSAQPVAFGAQGARRPGGRGDGSAVQLGFGWQRGAARHLRHRSKNGRAGDARLHGAYCCAAVGAEAGAGSEG